MTHSFSIPEEVSHITRTLEKAGFEAYLVGGCVRDLFLGIPPKDWDVTTNAKPEDVVSLFEKTFYENDYGTVGVVNERATDITTRIIEVTPYRTEGKYTDNRRPDSVSFNATLEDDLKRRDFTINAIALNPDHNLVIDPFYGRIDLQKGLIRAVGNPLHRFEEDGLRIMRAVRLHAQLGFSIETETESAIQNCAHLLKNIAKERIRDEFVRILESDHPMEGLTTAQRLGILSYVIPELIDSIGVEQNQAHAFDVWTHLLKSLQHAADKKLPLHIRLTALLHDIAKPATRRWSDEKKEWTFYGHEVVGERMAKKILRDLRFQNEMVDTVTKLVRWHMFFSDTEQITHSAVRRIVAKVGKESIWDLMNVRVCDRIGTGRPKENPYRLRKYKSMIEEVLRDPISASMLAIDGNRIIEVTNTPAGPKIGYIMHAILEEVLDDPTLNTAPILEEKAITLSKLGIDELKILGEKGKEKKEIEEEKIKKTIHKKYHIQ